MKSEEEEEEQGGGQGERKRGWEAVGGGRSVKESEEAGD